MSGRNKVGAQHFGILKEGFELYFAIAEDVRIRCSACFVFMQKVLEYVVPVLCGEVCLVEFDAKRVTDLLSVCQVFFCGAVFRPIVFIPVLHEQTFYLVALLEQQVGRNG